jgi:hypothetical protein
MSFAEQIKPAGLKSHDDIIKRVLLRPVSGALAVLRQAGQPSPSHL